MTASRANINPFRWGEGGERGTAPAALVGFWLSLGGLILWGILGASLGIHNWLVRLAGLLAAAALVADGSALLFGVRDSTNRTINWLRAGGSTVLSGRTTTYWRFYGLALIVVGVCIGFRALVP